MAIKTELIEKAMVKFPKARRIAVENFTMGYDSMNMEASMNLGMDARLYNWNSDTIKAIKFVLKG